MYLEKMYKILSNIAKELYKNNSEGLEQLRIKLNELMKLLLELAQVFPGKIEILKEYIAQLQEGIAQSDKLLLADLLYYDICGLIEEYAAVKGESLNIEKNRYSETEGLRERIAEDCYENNRFLFEKCDNIDYKSCIEYCDRFNCDDEEIALDTYANFAVYKDRWWRLNSFYNSEAVAESAVNQFSSIEYHSILVIYGMSNMDYIKNTLKVVPIDTAVIIYEPDKRVFAMNMYYQDMSVLVKRSRTYLFVKELNDNEDYIEKYIDKHYNSSDLQAVYSWISPNYDIIYYEDILKKKEYFDKCYREVQFFKDTNHNNSDVIAKNQIKNLSLLPQSIWLSDLKKLFEENIDFEKIPAIVVAAGPSLDKNIEELRKVQGKAFIIAVDSSVRMLEKYNIEPDAIITADPVKEKVLFENELVNRVPLFYTLESVHEHINGLKCPKIIVNNYNADCSMLTRFHKDMEALEVYGSVSNLALGVVRYIGFKTIITIGLDLAFEGNKIHASVVYEDGGVNEASNWAYDKVMGQNGEELVTYKNFLYYKQEIEKMIAADRGYITYINATASGALIEGAAHMPLTQAISKYCVGNADTKKLILKEAEDTVGIDFCIETVKQILSECSMLEKSLRKYGGLCEEVLANSNSASIQNKLNKISELGKSCENYAVMTALSNISQRELEQYRSIKAQQDSDSIEEYSESSSKGVGKNDGRAYIRTAVKEYLATSEIYIKNLKNIKTLLQECLEKLN